MTAHSEFDPHRIVERTFVTLSSPNGALDYANCDGVGGWALDMSNLSQTVTVDIYVDGTKVGSAQANGDRQDLVGAFGSSSARYHGFNYSFPTNASWRNGQSHSVSVRISGASNDIMSSPKTVNGCTGGTTNPPPSGNYAYAEGQFLLNWYGEQIYAHYYNGVLYASYQNGTDGFKPRSWLQATGFDTNKLACFATTDPHTSNPPPPPPPQGNNFAGNLDGADCNTISGWVVDRNTPNQSIKVDIYLNGIIVASNVPANKARQDVANALGISGYNAFGFNISLPVGYKVGAAWTISVKYAGTTTNIPGSPRMTTACQGSTTGGTTVFSVHGSGDCAQLSLLPGSGKAQSNVTARSGNTSFQLSNNGLKEISSLSSKLIPVKQGDALSLDAYAFVPVLTKRNLTPQLTTAAVGGVLAGLALTKQQATVPDQRHTNLLAPTLGVSTALMIPLVKSILANRIPNAGLELAFYDKAGQFVHRQQVVIGKEARKNWQLLHIDGRAPKDGYAVFRLMNRSKTPVYFDDLLYQATPGDNLAITTPSDLSPMPTSTPNGFDVRTTPSVQSVYSDCPEESVEEDWFGIVVVVKPDGIFIAEDRNNDGIPDNQGTFVPFGADMTDNNIGDTFTSIYTGQQYMWDGGSWVITLAEVEVLGNKPSNPYDGYSYTYTDPVFNYSITYEFIGGTWTMPVGPGNTISANPGKYPIGEFSDPCQFSSNIWSKSTEDRSEYFGVITQNGEYLITQKQSYDGGPVYGLYKQDGQAYYYYEANGATSSPYSGAVLAGKYFFIPIKATIHTHYPCIDDGTDGVSHPVSEDDVNLATTYYMITNYVIGCNGTIAQYDADNTYYENKTICSGLH